MTMRIYEVSGEVTFAVRRLVMARSKNEALSRAADEELLDSAFGGLSAENEDWRWSSLTARHLGPVQPEDDDLRQDVFGEPN